MADQQNHSLSSALPDAEPSSSTTASASIETPSSSSPDTKKCAHCNAPGLTTSSSDEDQPAAEKTLKPCSKCHTALYCSRECQKAAWKTHKKTCAADAQKHALATKEKPAAVPRVPKREGHRGGLQKWQFDT